MKKLLSIAMMLLLPASSWADYVLHADGYYYSGKQGYTRTARVVNGYYYQSGCYTYYQPGYTTYDYVPYYAPDVSYGPDWKNRLTAAADKLSDNIAYQTALEAYLNKVPRQAASAYGYNYSYGNLNSAVFGGYGINSSAFYGYSPASLGTVLNIDPYGKIDLNQQLLTYQQIVDGVNQAGVVATGNLDKTVNNVVGASVTFANQADRRNKILLAIRELQDPPVQATSTTTGKFGVLPTAPIAPVPPATIPTPPVASPPLSLQERWNASANACAKCHFDKKPPDGNWLLTDLSNPKILTRISLPVTHKDHMPPGKMLTSDELQTWAEAVASDANRKMPKIDPIPTLKK